MALYAFDGTWSEDEEDPSEKTNVVKFCDAYEANGGKVEYIKGVGTRFGAIGRVFGGVFGAGGQTRIEEMYRKLCDNWRDDDQHIDIIGFSRGAALAVHFSNVIDKVGIEVDGQDPATTPVRFLGLWDVVGSFGIPINFVLNFQDIDIGYDLISPDSVEHCFHAMALNERRQTFKVFRQDRKSERDNVKECWFRGVHSDVGGGNGNFKLSNIALQWMLSNAMEIGLPIDQPDIDRYASSDPTAPLGENFDPIKNPKRIVHATDSFHPTAMGEILATGASATFKVRAKEQYSWSGIRLEVGGNYAFSIPAGDTWKDAEIICGPDGWKSEDLPWYKEEFAELLEWRRRCSKANWFELIGSVGDDEESFFRIGSGGAGATFQAGTDGELFAFPNDLRSLYGNNHGEIHVTVTRVASPGGTRLKSCSEE